MRFIAEAADNDVAKVTDTIADGYTLEQAAGLACEVLTRGAASMGALSAATKSRAGVGSATASALN